LSLIVLICAIVSKGSLLIMTNAVGHVESVWLMFYLFINLSLLLIYNSYYYYYRIPIKKDGCGCLSLQFVHLIYLHFSTVSLNHYSATSHGLH
jgi:hypothetical protein